MKLPDDAVTIAMCGQEVKIIIRTYSLTDADLLRATLVGDLARGRLEFSLSIENPRAVTTMTTTNHRTERDGR